MLYNNELSLPVPLSTQHLTEFLEEKSLGKNVFKNIKYNYITTNFYDKLAPELVAIFESLNIKPQVFWILGHLDYQDQVYNTHLVHVDNVYDGSTYVKVPFAINWELTDTNPTLYWWDTKSDEGFEPPTNQDLLVHDWYRYGRGRLFGSASRIAYPDKLFGYELVHKYKPIKNRAFLLNTSLPHSVTYQQGHEYRVGISLRFPISQIASYEAALEIFKDYLI
jgi:hypothetical protein